MKNEKAHHSFPAHFHRFLSQLLIFSCCLQLLRLVFRDSQAAERDLNQKPKLSRPNREVRPLISHPRCMLPVGFCLESLDVAKQYGNTLLSVSA